ncbi:hypothetical protein [Nocardia wallacei]|uniref:hypothetical protein n=1 Tax=Nocardia wallacei TaxID=480035 RepID=UPI0024560045|nr:hypothetical protein [Nocardia wallacei]
MSDYGQSTNAPQADVDRLMARIRVLHARRQKLTDQRKTVAAETGIELEAIDQELRTLRGEA